MWVIVCILLLSDQVWYVRDAVYSRQSEDRSRYVLLGQRTLHNTLAIANRTPICELLIRFPLLGLCHVRTVARLFYLPVGFCRWWMTTG